MIISMTNVFKNEGNSLGPELALSEEISNFIHRVANSFIKIDLIRFFHNNPSTMDTIENISIYIGRDTEKVKRCLRDLANEGIVKIYKRENLELYSFTDEAEKKALLEKFFGAYEDRQERLKIIAHVIKEEKF